MIKLCNLPQVKEVYKAASDVLKSGKYVKGEFSKEFADKWADRCGMKYGVSVGSGAQALELAIKAINSLLNGPNKNWTYTEHTFEAVPNAIISNGGRAIPVKNENNPSLFAHHLHDEDPYFIPMLEDCSHCHGYKPKSNTAIFSLFPTKILGACGEAGIIVTNNLAIKNLCEEWASHGLPDGTNARMDEIQAAILLAKLPYLDEWIERRQEITNMYDKGLNRRTKGKYHYMYCIEGNIETVKKLISMGIESKLVYAEPYVALPFYPEMTNQQVAEVIKCVTQL